MRVRMSGYSSRIATICVIRRRFNMKCYGANVIGVGRRQEAFVAIDAIGVS